MISIYQIESRLNDLYHDIKHRDFEGSLIHNAKIDMLNWIKVDNKIRSVKEITNRIKRYQEELLAFSSTDNVYYKERVARINILNEALEGDNQ